MQLTAIRVVRGGRAICFFGVAAKNCVMRRVSVTLRRLRVHRATRGEGGQFAGRGRFHWHQSSKALSGNVAREMFSVCGVLGTRAAKEVEEWSKANK